MVACLSRLPVRHQAWTARSSGHAHARACGSAGHGGPPAGTIGRGTRLCLLKALSSIGPGRKAQVTRDTAGKPGGARGPRRPTDRRHPDAATTGDEPWYSGLTGPQRAFPVWDGAPGYEFENGRAARQPPPPPQAETPRFRYTPVTGPPARSEEH